MLIDSITAVLDSWQLSEQVYREFNNIPPDEQLSAEDWTVIAAVKSNYNRRRERMPKAADVAKELRRVAEALEREPETEIKRAAVCFFCSSKEQFQSTARVLPKPLAKKYDNDPAYPTINRVHLEYENDAIDLDCSVYRSLVCRLVEPAKAAVYDCEPLLSEEELEAV